MDLVDRVALLIRPKEPYWAWARARDEKAAAHVETTRERHVTVYLAETQDHKKQRLESVVVRHYEAIFAQELNSWHRREDDWPAPRTLAMFHE